MVARCVTGTFDSPDGGPPAAEPSFFGEAVRLSEAVVLGQVLTADHRGTVVSLLLTRAGAVEPPHFLVEMAGALTVLVAGRDGLEGPLTCAARLGPALHHAGLTQVVIEAPRVAFGPPGLGLIECPAGDENIARWPPWLPEPPVIREAARWSSELGAVNAIVIDRCRGVLVGAVDPRCSNVGAAY